MGSNAGEDDEQPPHTVFISAFQIDANEVTYAMYDTCVEKGVCTPAHYDDGKCLLWSGSGIRRVQVPLQFRSDKQPVVCVSWDQARSYCKYKGKRLPTEAEWEYAALGARSTVYAWGDQSPSSSTCARASDNKPKTVGTFPPNGWGIYDMSGNVWEWTDDRYTKDSYSVSQKDNPTGAPVGRYRVIRGGGWYSTANLLRIKNRQWFVPESGEVSIGFRCVK